MDSESRDMFAKPMNLETMVNSNEGHRDNAGLEQNVGATEEQTDSQYEVRPDDEDEVRQNVPALATTLYGTLTVIGLGSYYVYLRQLKTFNTWVLIDQDEDLDAKKDKDKIVAFVKIFTTNKILGKGQASIVLRLLDSLNALVQGAIQTQSIEKNFFQTVCEYSSPEHGEYLQYKTIGSSRYESLRMKSDDFILDLARTRKSAPMIKDVELQHVLGNDTKAAIIANLGVKTFAMLRKQKGSSLDWVDRKKYTLVDTPEKYTAMMLQYLRAVVKAEAAGKAVLTGIDTETTGLNMYNLSKGNEYVDHIVAIPFSWEDDVSYLICMDMAYFNNVPADLVYPVFDQIFSRPDDFGDFAIDIVFAGEHFMFRRNSIVTAGYNSSFDRSAFLCEGVNLYFDEDGMILMYDFAPGLVKGRNGLKDWTHVMTGDETLELEELFGANHKDKFRYLVDPMLALVYGCADADYTRVVVRNAIKYLPRQARYQCKKYDIPIMNILARASWNGMPVDSRAVREDGKCVESDMDQLMDFIYSYAYAVYRDGVRKDIDSLAGILGFTEKTSLDVIGNALEDASNREQFRFEFKPVTLKRFLFGVLNYPVIGWCDDGSPKMDKYVLDKLSRYKRDEPAEIMTADLMSTAISGEKLISADQFNSDLYPIAAVLRTYGVINKEFTSYYKPIMEHDLEGRMFYGFNMAYAATRRILSPGQTMKGSLKKLVKAPKGKLVLMFDASQIEFRLMCSEAYNLTMRTLQKKYPNDWEQRFAKTAIYDTFHEMQKSESDYHIQTASQMTKTPRHLVKPKIRKKYKTVGFGIPYGLSVYSLANDLYGKVTDETLKETQALMDDYYAKQSEIINLLETTRDGAFYPSEIEPHFREWVGLGKTPVGAVQNLVGFTYYFALEKLTRARTGRIRRQVGNCRVQGGAAELFRRMILNFYMACAKAGIQKKVEWFMVVHDELDTIIDDDCDVLQLIKIIHENCTLHFPNHVPYYVGIGLGYDWGTAKDDAAELPVIMVERLIDAYDNKGYRMPADGNQPKYLLQMKRHYMCDRVGELLSRIVPDLGPGYVWTDEVVEKVNIEFEEYKPRSYMEIFVPAEVKSRAKAENREVTLREQLEGWQTAREEYGFGVSFTDVKYWEEAPLTIEFSEAEIDNLEISLDTTADFSDLAVSLSSEFDDSDEESDNWFDEGSLFSYSATENMIASEEDNSVVYADLRRQNKSDEDDIEVNSAPKSAYDVYTTKHYVRTKISKSADGMYTALLNTHVFNNPTDFVNIVKRQCKQGNDTLIVIGSAVKIIKGIELTEETLDSLDKILCGTITV